MLPNILSHDDVLPVKTTKLQQSSVLEEVEVPASDQEDATAYF